jgi:hypothetical protein
MRLYLLLWNFWILSLNATCVFAATEVRMVFILISVACNTDARNVIGGRTETLHSLTDVRRKNLERITESVIWGFWDITQQVVVFLSRRFFFFFDS